MTDLNLGKYNATIAKYREQIDFMNKKQSLIDLHSRQLDLIKKIVQQKETLGLNVEKELKEYLLSREC